MRITKSIIMMITIDYTHQLSLRTGSHTEFSDRQPLSRVAHTLLYLAIPEYLSVSLSRVPCSAFQLLGKLAAFKTLVHISTANAMIMPKSSIQMRICIGQTSHFTYIQEKSTKQYVSVFSKGSDETLWICLD
jgi:hypothetical protein